jgi:hypothetical protein
MQHAAGGHRRRQGRPAGWAGFGQVVDRVVWLGNLPQRLPLVPLLPARRLARRLAQTARLPLGLVQPVGGLPLLELFSPSRRSNSATRASNTAMVS